MLPTTKMNFEKLLHSVTILFTIDIFFRTAVLRKLFDFRFSYKHCNFSHVCLLVKMASQTVTRSIAIRFSLLQVCICCVIYTLFSVMF